MLLHQNLLLQLGQTGERNHLEGSFFLKTACLVELPDFVQHLAGLGLGSQHGKRVPVQIARNSDSAADDDIRIGAFPLHPFRQCLLEKSPGNHALDSSHFTSRRFGAPAL
ncbi:hypothetical protein D3C81_1811560 [compost metagenome]